MAGSSTNNIDNMVKNFERVALEKAEQTDLSAPGMQTIDLPPMPVLGTTDTEARMCTVCWLDVEDTDSLWIATDCKPHQHLFHADCIATWWYSSGRRHCARCVQPVNGFTVYGHMNDGYRLWRYYTSANPLDDRVTMQHIIVEQSEKLDEVTVCDANTCVATCCALCPWQERNMMAGDGNDRAIRVWRACRAYLTRERYNADFLARKEFDSLKHWYDLLERHVDNETAEEEQGTGNEQ